MKKRVLTGFLIFVMALMLAIPAFATPAMVVDVPVVATQAEVEEPMESRGTEFTRIYWRTTSTGQLQFRVWGMTSGRWLTDWTNFG